MTFTQIRVLLAIARTGNATQAAKELATSQPAVSHALRNLERELGTTLFVRGRDGMTPTAAGHHVRRRASVILSQLEGLRQDLASIHDQVEGRLRIGVIPSANARLLPPVFRAFGASYPRVRLVVLEGSDSEVHHWLLDGVVDVATTTTTTHELVATPLAEDRMLAIVSTQHRLCDQASIAVADLADTSFIMSTGGCEPLITALAARAGVKLRADHRVRDTNSILMMVAEDLGVSILPELSCPVATHGIHAAPLTPDERRAIHLAVPGDRAPLPVATTFVEFATRRIGAPYPSTSPGPGSWCGAGPGSDQRRTTHRPQQRS